jgi:hypothetical protein
LGGYDLMIQIFFTMIIVFISLSLLHLLCLWLETKGWLYYIHKKPKGSTLGNGLQELNTFLNPSNQQTVEMQHKQAIHKRSEENNPSDKVS